MAAFDGNSVATKPIVYSDEELQAIRDVKADLISKGILRITISGSKYNQRQSFSMKVSIVCKIKLS